MKKQTAKCLIADQTFFCILLKSDQQNNNLMLLGAIKSPVAMNLLLYFGPINHIKSQKTKFSSKFI